MTVNDISGRCGLELVAGGDGLSAEIKNVYICDLLGWVMGHIKEGAAWITILGHVNVVAVASLSSVACIILAEGSNPSEDTLEKANEEGIPVFKSDMPAYILAKELNLF